MAGVRGAARCDRALRTAAKVRDAARLPRSAAAPAEGCVWFYSGWLEDDLDVFDPPMDRNVRQYLAREGALHLGARHPGRRGTERRDRARVAVRQGARREGSGRKEEDRRAGRARLGRPACPRRLAPGVRQRQLRPRPHTPAGSGRPPAPQRLDPGRHSHYRRHGHRGRNGPKTVESRVGRTS